MKLQRQDAGLQASVSKSLSGLFMLEHSLLRRVLLTQDISKLIDFTGHYAKDDSALAWANTAPFYSDLRPSVSIAQNVSGIEAERRVSAAVWVLIRELYINPARDRADLSAWIDDGLPFQLERLSRLALISHGKTPGAIQLHSKELGHLTAVATFEQSM